MRARATAVVLACLALPALLGYGLVAGHPSHSLDASVDAGRRPSAPALRLPSLDGGRPVALTDLRGRVVVVNYWASWCGPCRGEVPLLERWQHRLTALGGTVLGVDALDVRSDARRFVARYGVSYPIVRDESGTVARRYGVRGYPETVVIDRSGHVAAVRRGVVDEGFWTQSVAPVLREPA
jgi:cytochrome c biogenesis protein CcmG, thiol:disulfide interchange protein DsbE